jgi:hypothetical protein
VNLTTHTLCSVVVKDEWKYSSAPNMLFVMWTGPVLTFPFQFVIELKNFVVIILQ